MQIQELAEGIEQALTNHSGSYGLEQACSWVKKAVDSEEFAQRYLLDSKAGPPYREILFKHPQLEFCICGQVYDVPNKGGPHDHGHTWAIYGQVTGDTVMTEWEKVNPRSEELPIVVRPLRTYQLLPGDVQLYRVGDIHSPYCAKPVKLIRIEGSDLDHVSRLPYVAEDTAGS